MLADSPIHPVLLAKDLDAARDFYHGRIGLPILVDRPGEAVEFVCGAGTKLVVTKSTTGTADTQTQVGWTGPISRRSWRSSVPAAFGSRNMTFRGCGPRAGSPTS